MDILTENDIFDGALLTTAPLELKLMPAALDAGTIEGYGATFNRLDHVGDRIQSGAFAETIAAHSAAGSAPGMLWDHRSSQPVGKWTGMGEDMRGLKVRGRLNLDTSAGQRAHAHVMAGDVSGLSIGYQPAPGGQKVNKDGTRTLSKLVLHEVSLTPIPADHGARITQVKKLGSRGDLEDLLQESGLPRAAARKVAAAGWPALSGEEPDAKPDPRILNLIQKTAAMALELKGIRS